MRVLITGGSGFIGRVLCDRLLQESHEVQVISRDPVKVARYLPSAVTCLADLSDLVGSALPDVIINLAGENLSRGRWNEQRKQLFLQSRLNTTKRLVEWIGQSTIKPKILISGSAIGYYGAHDDEVLDEQAEPAHEFAANLCQAWEKQAAKAEAYGVRVCLLRIGIVLGRGGGALSPMLLPFRLGLGGRMGSGKQWMLWVHINDLVGMIIWMMNNHSVSGPINGTAPNPVTNAVFAHALGAALHRPVFFPMPSFLLKILLGEMAHMVLTGQRVIPKKALDGGYQFQYADLSSALSHIVTSG